MSIPRKTSMSQLTHRPMLNCSKERCVNLIDNIIVWRLRYEVITNLNFNLYYGWETPYCVKMFFTNRSQTQDLMQNLSSFSLDWRVIRQSKRMYLFPLIDLWSYSARMPGIHIILWTTADGAGRILRSCNLADRPNPRMYPTQHLRHPTSDRSGEQIQQCSV